MSKIAITGNASGTGTFTLAAPNSDTDVTINLPTVTGGEFIVSNASGNVGIGTASPVSIGSGYGTLDVRGPTGGGYRWGNATDSAYTYADSTSTVLGTATSKPLALVANNVERVRIESSGTSNFFANNPIFAATSAGANSTSANAIFIGYHSATSTTALGTSSIVITSNGNIFNTNGSYGSLSDAKLKENIVDATPKLDKLNQVRVVNYNLKGELGHETHKQIGVIAQELEQIFPGMVEESPDRDAEGNDLGTVTKAVKYSVFVPMLIKAIQELNAKVDAQAAEIAALKGQA